MATIEHKFVTEQWEGKDAYEVECGVKLLRVVTEGDGHRHGNYQLVVRVAGGWHYEGRYWLTRVRLPFDEEALEITDILPPRAGHKWHWHPEKGWDKSPIGALDWVEERVLLWVYGMDELLDVIHPE